MRYFILVLFTFLFSTPAAHGQSIAPSAPLCVGGTYTLTGTPLGGTWASANPTIATISGSGEVTGLTSGTTMITYTFSGIPVIEIVTVNPLPSPITGSPEVCVGGTTLLSSATSSGCVWLSHTPAIASVDATGLVTGYVPGIVVISYYYFSTSCSTSVIVTVNPNPTPITGTTNVCLGSTTTLHNAVPGGIWTSGTPFIAPVDPTTGVVTGAAVGDALITYVLPTGCSVFDTVSVLPLPSPILGGDSVCVGGSLTLTSATPGGTWSSSSLAVGSVSSSGIFAGLTSGNTTINYTVMPSTCAISTVITVNALPAPIIGTSAVCSGASILLGNATPGGSWSTSNPSVAVVSGSGSVTGIGSGMVTISYLLSTGCFATKIVTVNPSPDAISGPGDFCAGLPVGMTCGPSGGTWISGNPSIVMIDAATGVATGLSAGMAAITYSLASTSCFTTRIITINPTPGPITGTAVVCPGATTSLGNTVAGGLWISGATTVATVGIGPGISTTVTGVAAGTTEISYIIGGSCMATRTVSVHAPTSAGTLFGPSIVCAASSVSLGSTVTGGTWSSAAASIATVSSAGAVTGVTPGTTTITYTVTGICGSAFTTRTVTVSVVPTAIAGTTSFCAGTSSTLSNAVPGGTWSSTTSTIAPVGSATGTVTGLGAGVATIIYSISTGCFVTAGVTVNPAPGPITGAGIGTICVGGILPLSDTASGGTWTSSAPGIAMIATLGSTPGVVTGLAPGVAVMSYSIGSCVATVSITVNPLPTISATATPASCGNAWSLNASGGVSYSWSPSAGLSCGTCAATGAIPPATMSYTVTSVDALGCANTATVSVTGDRIDGHITFSAATPFIPNLKVWLVQFNPSDSSIIATDSVLTCMDGALPYYRFDGKPTGSYLVKARLLSSAPGSSDYIPTYGASTPNWFDATPITYTGSAALLDINMIYGTVPVGPGFISGYVYSGAGKGTSGDIPEAGMLIFLKDATTGQVLTYTYTGADGGYSFPSVAYGSYVIYPEEQAYYTTPTGAITLAAGSGSATNVSFKKHTAAHSIYPYSATGIHTVSSHGTGISIYPNPASGALYIQWPDLQSGAATIALTDMTGRTVISETLEITPASPSQLQLSSLIPGMYFINVQAEGINHTGKVIVE